MGRRGPPHAAVHGLAWTPRAVSDSDLSPIAQGRLGSISPSSQSACYEACSPAAHGHRAAFLRGPAPCQLPTGTGLRSSQGRLHASCPWAQGCVPPTAGWTSSAYCAQVSVSLGDKRPLFLPCSPDTCTSPMPAHPAPSSLTPHQWGAGTQLGRGGRGPGRSQLQPGDKGSIPDPERSHMPQIN